MEDLEDYKQKIIKIIEKIDNKMVLEYLYHFIKGKVKAAD